MYSSTGDFHFSFLYLTDKRLERQTGFIPDPHFAIRLHGKCRMRFSAAGKRLPKSHDKLFTLCLHALYGYPFFIPLDFDGGA